MIGILLFTVSMGWTAFAAYRWGRTAERNKVYKKLTDGYGAARQSYLDDENRNNALILAGYSRAVDDVLHKNGD